MEEESTLIVARNPQEKVNVMDQEDNLQILNYTECRNDSPEELKKVRGRVQEISTGRILFETFPYTEEYGLDTHREELVGKVGDLAQWDVFYSLEGTLLRVFWYGERWYISTNKKLNAFKSRWSSRKSFGELFRDGLVGMMENENALEKLMGVLNQKVVYLFLVRSNAENRVVCQVEKNKKEHIVFVGGWNEEKKSLDREWKHEDICPMLGSSRVPESFLTSQEALFQGIADMDMKKFQGAILFHKTENRQMKILSETYHQLLEIRGNNPNLRFRYLEVRLQEDKKKVLYDLYPMYQDLFLDYENILYNIAKLVRYYYIQRYIKNKYVTLPKEEYVLMKKCHDWYLLNREENKVTVGKVLDLLNEELPLSLYKMIRRYQLQQYRPPLHREENEERRRTHSEDGVAPFPHIYHQGGESRIASIDIEIMRNSASSSSLLSQTDSIDAVVDQELVIER